MAGQFITERLSYFTTGTTRGSKPILHLPSNVCFHYAHTPTHRRRNGDHHQVYMVNGQRVAMNKGGTITHLPA